MKADIFFKLRLAVGYLAIAGLAVWGGFKVVDLVEMHRTREVFAAISAASEARKQRGPTLEAAEAYVATLRGLDLSYLKKDLRPAFEAYVAGLEESLALAREGRDTAPADAKVAAAQRALAEIAERYN